MILLFRNINHLRGGGGKKYRWGTRVAAAATAWELLSLRGWIPAYWLTDCHTSKRTQRAVALETRSLTSGAGEERSAADGVAARRDSVSGGEQLLLSPQCTCERRFEEREGRRV